MVNQAVQFTLLVAGLLPVVLMGLRGIGGRSGLKAGLPLGVAGAAHSGGMEPGLGISLGLLLGAAYWCADFGVLQTAMAAESVQSARRVPLLAAIPMAFLPLLLILPGVAAIGLPTPRTTTVTRIENGAIIHTITVVRPEAEAGEGLVPARIDPATKKPMIAAGGEAVLDYEMATPAMLAHFLPTGLLGLGLAALLACLMSGLAANLTAFSTVFTCDLYGPLLRRKASDGQTVSVGRWAAVGGALLSILTAFAAARLNSVLGAMILVFSVAGLPLFGVVLLGMFWKRATGHGAFAGLVCGAGLGLSHHGLTRPAAPWIAMQDRAPNFIAHSFWTAILSLGASILAAAAVSLCTEARAKSDLVGLVYSLTPKLKRAKQWWERPWVLAAGVLVLSVAVGLFSW